MAEPFRGTLVGLVLAGCAACQTPGGADSAAARPEPKIAPAASSSEPAVSEPAPLKQEGTHVRGTIESIRLQNINKALGHYTYNVELVVRHDGGPPPDGSNITSLSNPLTVRVDKVFWSRLGDAEREAVAPDGPQQVLSPQRWRDYAVGATVDLDVELTSSDLAQLRK